MSGKVTLAFRFRRTSVDLVPISGEETKRRSEAHRASALLTLSCLFPLMNCSERIKIPPLIDSEMRLKIMVLFSIVQVLSGAVGIHIRIVGFKPSLLPQNSTVQVPLYEVD